MKRFGQLGLLFGLGLVISGMSFCPGRALTTLGLGEPGDAGISFLEASARLNACLKAPVLHRRDERGASRGFVGYSGRDAAGTREIHRARAVI